MVAMPGALPAVKISVQALTLQMAAEKQLGADKFGILDRQTVSMPHPEAMQALLSGRTEITSHFASMPFLWIEEKDPKVRTILSSYDVVGGPHTGSRRVSSRRRQYTGLVTFGWATRRYTIACG